MVWQIYGPRGNEAFVLSDSSVKTRRRSFTAQPDLSYSCRRQSRTVVNASSFAIETLVPSIERHFDHPSTVEWIQKMLDSYYIEMGEELLPNRSQLSKEQQAVAIALSPIAIGSHEYIYNPDEPTFNYGNIGFLDAFGYSWDEFVGLWSRYSVTPEEFDERQELLDCIKRGEWDPRTPHDILRVRKDGSRVLLEGVTLWNVYGHEDGKSGVNRRKVIGLGVAAKGAVYFENDMSVFA